MTGKMPDLTIIVPIHNSSPVLKNTLDQLHEKFLGTSHEILLVENGSRDNSWEICKQLCNSFSDLNIKVFQSEPGLGSAIQKGIRESAGKRLLITADELPFGFDELDQSNKYRDGSFLIIGSKAHPLSIVPRGWKRSLSSQTFRILRKLVLRSNVGDSQGTFVVDGVWIRSRLEKLSSSGFIITAEIVEIAERDHLQIIEVPVRLRNSHELKKSSVKARHIVAMLLGIFRIRIKRSHSSHAPI